MEQSDSADNRQGTLKTEDLAWLGGLIDGEGFIILRKKVVGYVPTVGLTNTDKAIIEEAHRILSDSGVGHWICVSKHRNRVKLDRWSNCQEIRIEGEKRCRRALEVLRPWIRGGKLANAGLLEDFLERRLAIGKHAHSWDAVDDAYYFRMKELNGRDASTTTRQTPLGEDIV